MLAVPVLLCSAQTGRKGGALLFEETHFDFGEIEESAGPVRHSFAFVNATSSTVTLNMVIPSCSCTTVDYDHSAVPAGAVREITVIYDPSALPGQFKQNVLVRAGDRSQYRLFIEGTVKERELGRDEEYPYFLADGLQCSSLKANFGYVRQGTSAERRIGIVNVSSDPVRLGWTSSSRDDALDVSLPAVLAPGGEAVAVISYAVPSGRTGTLDNSVTITVNGSPASRKLAVEGAAVPVAQGSASFRFDPTMVRFSGNRKSASVTLHNDGGSPLEVIRVECSDGVETDIAPGMVVPAGKSRTVSVRRVGRASDSGRIRVFTNDASRPMRDIIFKTIK